MCMVAVYAWVNFKPTTQVTINAAVYNLAVANTDAQLKQGLSGVEKLPPNGGLLMVFGSDYQWGIWMKDMKIPLDIVWLDSNKKVVYIQENASPELGTDVIMQPKDPSRYVLELPVGSVKNAGIKMGLQAQFTLKGSN